MIKRTRERIAFWLEMMVFVAITVTSIYYASQIGYQQAIRFSQWQDNYQGHQALHAMRQELLLNREAIQAALENWDSEAFTELHITTQAFQRARDSDDYFQLEKSTIESLSRAYAQSLQDVISAMRKQVGGPASRAYARILRHHLERIDDAIPEVEKTLALRKTRLDEYGIALPDSASEWIGEPATGSPGQEKRKHPGVTSRTSSAAWQAVSGEEYTGRMTAISWQQVSTIPVTSGPVLLSYSISRTSELKDHPPQRLVLVLSATAPIDMDENPDSQRLRQLLAGRTGDDSIALAHPLPAPDAKRIEGEILDAGSERRWRWAYVLIEDSAGNRFPVSQLSAWRVGPGKAWQYWREASDGALLLPTDYSASPAR